jgi:hypothetical protein
MNDPKPNERTAKIPTDAPGDAAMAATRRELTDDQMAGLVGGKKDNKNVPWDGGGPGYPKGA